MKYQFSIKVMLTGEQYPLIEFTEPDLFPLNNLASGDVLTRSTSVKKELDHVHEVINGTLESYSFADNDWCIIDVTSQKTIISNGFDQYDPISVNTLEFERFLSEWMVFLTKYENNEIPFLSYNRK